MSIKGHLSSILRTLSYYFISSLVRSGCDLCGRLSHSPHYKDIAACSHHLYTHKQYRITSPTIFTFCFSFF